MHVTKIYVKWEEWLHHFQHMGDVVDFDMPIKSSPSHLLFERSSIAVAAWILSSCFLVWDHRLHYHHRIIIAQPLQLHHPQQDERAWIAMNFPRQLALWNHVFLVHIHHLQAPTAMIQNKKQQWILPSCIKATSVIRWMWEESHWQNQLHPCTG